MTLVLRNDEAGDARASSFFGSSMTKAPDVFPLSPYKLVFYSVILSVLFVVDTHNQGNQESFIHQRTFYLATRDDSLVRELTTSAAMLLPSTALACLNVETYVQTRDLHWPVTPAVKLYTKNNVPTDVMSALTTST